MREAGACPDCAGEIGTHGKRWLCRDAYGCGSGGVFVDGLPFVCERVARRPDILGARARGHPEPPAPVEEGATLEQKIEAAIWR